MDTKKVIITDSHVTGPTGNYEVGQEVEISLRSADALIAEGKAKPIEEKAEENPSGGNGQGQSGDNLDDLAKLTAAIDAKFKKEDLTEAAKKLEVQFAYDAKKADVIAAVIAAGKGEAILA